MSCLKRFEQHSGFLSARLAGSQKYPVGQRAIPASCSEDPVGDRLNPSPRVLTLKPRNTPFQEVPVMGSGTLSPSLSCYLRTHPVCQHEVLHDRRWLNSAITGRWTGFQLFWCVEGPEREGFIMRNSTVLCVGLIVHLERNVTNCYPGCV